MATYTTGRFISNILASTVEKTQREITEHVINEIPLFRLMEKHRSKKMLDGGLSYTYPLLVGGNEAVFYDPASQVFPYNYGAGDAFNPADIPNLAAVPIFVRGENKWSWVMNSIAITADEELENMGSERIVDLISGKLRNAELHFAYKLNTALYTQQLTTRLGAEFMSLQALAPPYAGDFTISGGEGSHVYLCSGVAYDNASFNLVSWKNKYEVAQSDYSDLMDQWLDLRVALDMEGAFKTTVIVTHSGAYKAYEKAGQNQVKFMSTDQLDFGFENVTYKRIPILTDDRCLCGAASAADLASRNVPCSYFLNLDTFGFFVHSKRNVDVSPLENDPRYVDAKTAKMKFMGGTWCNNRRAQGVVIYSA